MNKDHVLQITDSHSQPLTCWSFYESSFTLSEKLRLQLSLFLSLYQVSIHTYTRQDWELDGSLRAFGIILL